MFFKNKHKQTYIKGIIWIDWLPFVLSEIFYRTGSLIYGGMKTKRKQERQKDRDYVCLFV